MVQREKSLLLSDMIVNLLVFPSWCSRVVLESPAVTERLVQCPQSLHPEMVKAMLSFMGRKENSCLNYARTTLCHQWTSSN